MTERRFWTAGAFPVRSASWALLLLVGLLSGCGGRRSEVAVTARYVTVGSSVTETVFALGGGANVVGVDASSLFPEATAALQDYWANSATIRLYDQERMWEATPAEMGLSLDARATAETARSIGLSGVPFGYGVQPVVALDELASQDYFLDLTEWSKILPYNAGYRWEGEQLVGVPGSDGRFLNIAATMSATPP